MVPLLVALVGLIGAAVPLLASRRQRLLRLLAAEASTYASLPDGPGKELLLEVIDSGTVDYRNRVIGMDMVSVARRRVRTSLLIGYPIALAGFLVLYFIPELSSELGWTHMEVRLVGYPMALIPLAAIVTLSIKYRKARRVQQKTEGDSGPMPVGR